MFKTHSLQKNLLKELKDIHKCLLQVYFQPDKKHHCWI